MTEASTKKTAKAPSTYETLDLSTPMANAMKLWQGEVEKAFDQTEKQMERTAEMSRKLYEEQTRLFEAQMNASQEAMRSFFTGMQRMTKAGVEA